MSNVLSLPLARLLSAVVVFLCCAENVLAWGSTGHRLIGRLAVEALPAELPAFLRGEAAAQAVGELAREPDRWKGAGKVHDTGRDPAHFLDLGDDGRVLGGPALAALPPTREAFETALRAVGADSWKAAGCPIGPRRLAATGQGLRLLAVDTAAARTVADAAHRAWFVGDAAEREALILRDLGSWATMSATAASPCM